MGKGLEGGVQTFLHHVGRAIGGGRRERGRHKGPAIESQACLQGGSEGTSKTQLTTQSIQGSGTKQRGGQLVGFLEDPKINLGKLGTSRGKALRGKRKRRHRSQLPCAD